MKRVSVVLIGYGKMGYGLGNKDKFSHFGALQFLKKKFILKSVIDKKFANCKNFYTSNIDYTLKKHKPELAVISVNTKNHFNVIMKLLKNKFCPKVLFLDKPSLYDLAEFNKVIKFLKDKKNIKIIVNQTYRFNKNIEKLKNYIKTKKLGKLKKVSINYTNGLTNNAIHLIDIFYYLFPNNFNLKPLWSHKSLTNNKSKDKLNYDFCLYDKNKKVMFQGQSFDKDLFEVFELSFYFSNCRIVIEDYFKEFFIHKIKLDKFNNKEIKKRQSLFKNTLDNPLLNAYKRIYNYFIYKKIDKKFEIFENKKTIKIIDDIKKNEQN